MHDYLLQWTISTRYISGYTFIISGYTIITSCAITILCIQYFCNYVIFERLFILRDLLFVSLYIRITFYVCYFLFVLQSMHIVDYVTTNSMSILNDGQYSITAHIIPCGTHTLLSTYPASHIPWCPYIWMSSVHIPCCYIPWCAYAMMPTYRAAHTHWCPHPLLSTSIIITHTLLRDFTLLMSQCWELSYLIKFS